MSRRPGTTVIKKPSRNLPTNVQVTKIGDKKRPKQKKGGMY